MEILLVVPLLAGTEKAFYNFPLGLAYISSALKEAGFTVHIINQNSMSGNLHDEMKRYLTLHPIGCVCTGGLSPDYPSINEIYTQARHFKSDIFTICGGGLVSSQPEIAGLALGFDIGICGEGEETVVCVMQALISGGPIGLVDGIVLREADGSYTKTPPRKSRNELDDIAFPDFAGFDIDNYLDRQYPNDTYATAPIDTPRMIQVIGSRSCPYNCTFCFHPLGKQYRYRSLDNLFQEIDYLIDYHDVNIFMLYDELFASGTNVERMVEFCHRIKKRNVFWRVSLRVDCINKELLDLMKESGCFYIAYGIENINDTILASMKKNVTKVQIENALSLTSQANIGIQGNLLFGDIAESEGTVNENIDWWKENLNFQLHLVSLATFPGSSIYKYALRKGVIENQVEYLQSGEFYVNLTSMSDEKYFEIINRIGVEQQEHLIIEADVIDSKKERKDKHGKWLSDFTVNCPHCSSQSTYRNIIDQQYTSYNIHFDMHKLTCRFCCQRFDVPAIK